VIVAALVLRALLGGVLAWWITVAAHAPEIPIAATAAALVIAGLTVWRPSLGLLATVALTPAGSLFAAAPARGAELFAASFSAAWLLSLWRPLSRRPWPRGLVIPAALYAVALAGSWVSLFVASAAGVSVTALVPFLVHSIPADHLVFSSPEPETWILLQTTTGIGLLLAAVGLTRDDASLVRPLAWTCVAAAGALGVATVVEVGSQWSAAGYAMAFLARYVSGERFALHLTDLNAAGSWYALAAVAAAGSAISATALRGAAITALGVIGIAIWFTGSRSAYLAVTVGALVLASGQQRWPLTKRQVVPVVGLLAVVLLAGTIASDWRAGETGSTAMSARLRSQFLVTTGRMFASAPVFGVGVGRYFDRSAEFMSDELRTLYGNENAHNYFAQQFAELGLVGGILFLWLVGTLVVRGWKAVRGGSIPEHLGLYAGVIAYLTTCVTGHPLLVPEAALPFWIAAGSVAANLESSREGGLTPIRTAVAAAAVVAIAAGVISGTIAYARTPSEPPREYGFHQPVTDEGATFRWMVRHAVTYVPNENGFLHLRVRAPQETRNDRPLVLETSLAGRVADRREVPSDRWFTYHIPVRQTASGPFQRVDLRVNQWWQQEVRLGQRRAMRPIAAMVADARWIPLSEAGR
jgi:O-antigen ligase